MARKNLNWILVAIVVAFIGYELATVIWNEPGQDVMLSLTEWAYSLGWWARVLMGIVLPAWLVVHFVAPKYDPISRMLDD